MSERFFRSNRPGYPHPVSSEVENSGIRVAVGDCSVTERRRWRPPYQTGKTVHVHAKHYTLNKDGRSAPGVCGNGSVPLSHSGNVVTRIGIHTHTHSKHETFCSPEQAYAKDVALYERLFRPATFAGIVRAFIHRRRKRGGGWGRPPNNLGGGPTYPLAPPNNPPTFSFNFYVKQEKITNVPS